METEAEAFKKQVLLGRVYFLAVLPFIAAVVIPWVLGPGAVNPTPTFILWSYAVLVFTSAANVGYALGRADKRVLAYGLIALLFAAVGIACVLLALIRPSSVVSVVMIALLHWLNWLWMQKSQAWKPDVFKQHNRFVWTALACHMLVVLNLIYVARVLS